MAPLLAVLSRFLKTYQLERIISFINPQYDPSGINYNSLQSAIAIGSGFIFGKGFYRASQSKLHFLPEAHTDFAFATFIEAFGFLGGTLVLGLLFYLLFSLLKEWSQNRHGELYRNYIFGVTAFFFIQTVFNVGMNLRLLPVVGVPLPFISYGGSGLLSNFILLSLGAKLKELG
jgi:rod shape determining protein RodA